MKIFIAGFLLFGLASCGNDAPEDRTQTVDKAGAIETYLETKHLDSMHDIVITTHKVWVKYNLAKTIEHTDTLPALGNYASEGENNDGDTKKVNVKGDYEFYITVK